MDKNTLKNEIKNLKKYLKNITKNYDELSKSERNLVNHYLFGCITSISALIESGAYYNKIEDAKIFDALSSIRDKIIHNITLDGLLKITSQADELVNTLVDNPSTNPPAEKQYHEITDSYVAFSMKECNVLPYNVDSCFKFESKTSKESVYINKNNVVAVNGIDRVSYIIKNYDEPIFYYKNGDNATELLTLSQLEEKNIYEKMGRLKKNIRLNANLNRIIHKANRNPYDIHNVKYDNSNKSVTINMYKVLNDFLYNSLVDEKIAYSNIQLHGPSEIFEAELNNNSNINYTNLADNIHLLDYFYITFFLKKYNEMKHQLSSLKYTDFTPSQIATTRKAFIISLYQYGLFNISNDFIDSNEYVSNLFHVIRRSRNEFAHGVFEDPDVLNENLDKTFGLCDRLYLIFSNAINEYSSDRISRSERYNYLSQRIDNIIRLKTRVSKQCYIINHKSHGKIINGTKYLKVNVDGKNDIYLEADKALLSLNYITKLSKQCIVPLNSLKFVHIDPDSNIISNVNIDKNNLETIDCDLYLSLLLKAYSILKPMSQRLNDSFMFLTCYDNKGNPVCGEILNYTILRRDTQKVIPVNLLEANYIEIDKTDKSTIKVFNSKGNLIASISLAISIKENNHIVYKKFSGNRELSDIVCANILPKNIDTFGLIEYSKETILR